MNARRHARTSFLALSLLLALAACSTTESPQPAAPEPPAAMEPAPPEESPAPANLLVDHAWARDADAAQQQAAQVAAMAALRERVVAGGGFNASWNALNLDGANWHVAEGETYPSDVLPAEVRNLPAGTITPVVPGDGGLHLFRIIRREPLQ